MMEAVEQVKSQLKPDFRLGDIAKLEPGTYLLFLDVNTVDYTILYETLESMGGMPDGVKLGLVQVMPIANKNIQDCVALFKTT